MSRLRRSLLIVNVGQTTPTFPCMFIDDDALSERVPNSPCHALSSTMTWSRQGSHSLRISRQNISSGYSLRKRWTIWMILIIFQATCFGRRKSRDNWLSAFNTIMRLSCTTLYKQQSLNCCMRNRLTTSPVASKVMASLFVKVLDSQGSKILFALKTFFGLSLDLISFICMKRDTLRHVSRSLNIVNNSSEVADVVFDAEHYVFLRNLKRLVLRLESHLRKEWKSSFVSLITCKWFMKWESREKKNFMDAVKSVLTYQFWSSFSFLRREMPLNMLPLTLIWSTSIFDKKKLEKHLLEDPEAKEAFRLWLCHDFLSKKTSIFRLKVRILVRLLFGFIFEGIPGWHIPCS